LDSGSKRAILPVLALEDDEPVLAAELLDVVELLLSSLPQAATPNVRAAAATTVTHFELRMESTLLLEVQGTGIEGSLDVRVPDHAWISWR
jgi:hypothetical protein